MREVVIINTNTRGAAYGVGTYITELIHCLQESGVTHHTLWEARRTSLLWMHGVLSRLALRLYRN